MVRAGGRDRASGHRSGPTAPPRAARRRERTGGRLAPQFPGCSEPGAGDFYGSVHVPARRAAGTPALSWIKVLFLSACTVKGLNRSQLPAAGLNTGRGAGPGVHLHRVLQWRRARYVVGGIRLIERAMRSRGRSNLRNRHLDLLRDLHHLGLSGSLMKRSASWLTWTSSLACRPCRRTPRTQRRW